MKGMLATAAMCAALLAPSAMAAPFQNGSFEKPGGTNIRSQIDNSGTAVTAWTSSGGYQVYEDNVGGSGDSLTALDGTHWVSFGHNGATGGTLSQVFDSVLGATYTLNYSVAEQQGYDTDSSFNVYVDGTLLGNSGTPGSSGTWMSAGALTFVGTGLPTTLTFEDATLSGGSSNLALDAVSLKGPASLPEPATWALMILGMGFAGLAMRRRGEVRTAHA
jgi:hypothetical protein